MEKWQAEYEKRFLDNCLWESIKENVYVNEADNVKTRNELIEKIKAHFNLHFKWQKVVLNWELDIDKLNEFTDKELENFYKENCS